MTRDYSKLQSPEIERIFFQTVLDLKQILVLDRIDFLPQGYRMHCHDLYGPLPEILINHSGDTFLDKERLGYQVCKLTAIAKLRESMRRCLPGGKFLLPTRMDSRVIVGFRVGPKACLAEGDDFIQAYQNLHEEIVG